jgi:hypothetical protein
MQMGGSRRSDLAAPFGEALGSKYPPGIPSLGPHRNLLTISPRGSAAHLRDTGRTSLLAFTGLLDPIGFVPVVRRRGGSLWHDTAAQLWPVLTAFPDFRKHAKNANERRAFAPPPPHASLVHQPIKAWQKTRRGGTGKNPTAQPTHQHIRK